MTFEDFLRLITSLAMVSPFFGMWWVGRRRQVNGNERR